MGFNKKYLPQKKELEQMVYDYGAKYVIDRFTNAKIDALMGPSDSFDYLQLLIKKYELD